MEESKYITNAGISERLKLIAKKLYTIPITKNTIVRITHINTILLAVTYLK